jgi:hypothetical protein
MVPILSAWSVQDMGKTSSDLRSTTTVTDKLVDTYSCRSLEMSSSIVADPGDVQSGCDVKTYESSFASEEVKNHSPAATKNSAVYRPPTELAVARIMYPTEIRNHNHSQSTHRSDSRIAQLL